MIQRILLTLAILILTGGNTFTRVDAAPAAAAPPRLYFALVAPFATVNDDVSAADLKAFWQGGAPALAGAGALFASPDTLAQLGALGELRNKRVQPVAAGALAAALLGAKGPALAIVPFERLEPRYKVISIDGVHLLDKNADISAYPLAAPAKATNRDPAKMTVVALTGVTALVRGTAVMMEKKGITYPGEKIRDWLKSADIAHISNEVSFWDKCPNPTFNDGTTMCSKPGYIELLKYVGADIIELTGNHLWDRGWQYLNGTLDTYDAMGWVYFGGGRNAASALDPVKYDLNGSKIAFVGCNWFGSDWARDDRPGSARCGSKNAHDLDLIVPLIKKLTAEGFMVIVGIQYQEYYDYAPQGGQERDFKALREAGAVIVNGSQGHHAQGFDVNAQGFIHYGTGNLFFGDQAGVGTHQSFVDRHAFYDGRYLGVELKTAYIRDNSQPVPMTGKERAALLGKLFGQ